jgi:phage terminase large subunit-like protein
MSPAIRELESMILARKFRTGNHPVLNMCMNNATVAMDPAGNRKFVKGKASGRIDGAVSLAMAVGVLPAVVDEGEPQLFI